MATPSTSPTPFTRALEDAYRIVDAYRTHVGPVAELTALQRQFERTCSLLRASLRRTEVAVDESETEEESQTHVTTLSQQRTQYEHLQQAYKAAAVSRKSLQKQLIEEARKELLDAGNTAEKRKQWRTEADLMAASKGVTESLTRTKRILAQELEQSGAQLAAIELSQEQLSKTNKEYDEHHGKLKTAQGLIRVVDWQNQSERYLLWAGIWLFAACAAWVVQKRCMYFVPESLRPMAMLRYAYSTLKRSEDPGAGGDGLDGDGGEEPSVPAHDDL
jgi:hypothetical protein